MRMRVQHFPAHLKVMCDPLNYFAGEGDCSSSSDEEGTGLKEVKVTAIDEADQPDDSSKLPSPNTLFATVGRPSFLKDVSHDCIDWDKFVKNPDPAEPNVHAVSGYTAIPPPPETTASEQSVISAAPVKYTPADVDPKFRTVSSVSDAVSAGSKRSSKEEDGGETKKQKTETFRTKEKRKRDLGQSSRGKSYVEEEKRILRQAFGSDEIIN